MIPTHIPEFLYHFKIVKKISLFCIFHFPLRVLFNFKHSFSNVIFFVVKGSSRIIQIWSVWSVSNAIQFDAMFGHNSQLCMRWIYSLKLCGGDSYILHRFTVDWVTPLESVYEKVEFILINHCFLQCCSFIVLPP